MAFQVVTAELSPHGKYRKRVSSSGEQQKGIPNPEPQAGMPVPLCSMTFNIVLRCYKLDLSSVARRAEGEAYPPRRQAFRFHAEPRDSETRGRKITTEFLPLSLVRRLALTSSRPGLGAISRADECTMNPKQRVA